MSIKPLVKNAADESQVKEAGDKEKRGRERDLEDLRFVLGAPQGRRFLRRLLGETAGIYKTTFTGSSETFFREGMRNVGLSIMSEINEASPGAYAKMLLEFQGE